MSLFDQNTWYQITIPLFKNMSMLGLHPNQDTGNTAAAVFFQITNTTKPSQRWQIWHIQDNTYVLRSEASGPKNYLAVRANTTTEREAGGTTAIIRRVDAAGKEAFWRLNPFSNGGFGMVNAANGTNWRLFAKDKGLMAMTNNVKGEQDNQSFQFKKLEKITNEKFSTLQTPTARLDEKSSSGLSTGAKAAIGASVCGIALIAIIVAVLFFLRRRRQKNRTKQSPLIGELSEYATSSEAVKYKHSATHELDPSNQRNELDHLNTVNEMDGRARAVELPGDPGPVRVKLNPYQSS